MRHINALKEAINNSQYFENLQSLQNLPRVSTEASKDRCYSRLSITLMEPFIS